MRKTSKSRNNIKHGQEYRVNIFILCVKAFDISDNGPSSRT